MTKTAKKPCESVPVKNYIVNIILMTEIIPAKKLGKLLKAADEAYTKEKGERKDDWSQWCGQWMHDKLKEEEEKGICEFC